MERYGNKELAVSDLLFLLGPKNMPKELVDIVQETMITKLLDIDNYIKD